MFHLVRGQQSLVLVPLYDTTARVAPALSLHAEAGGRNRFPVELNQGGARRAQRVRHVLGHLGRARGQLGLQPGLAQAGCCSLGLGSLRHAGRQSCGMHGAARMVLHAQQTSRSL